MARLRLLDSEPFFFAPLREVCGQNARWACCKAHV
jgi:hypothetical protein